MFWRNAISPKGAIGYLPPWVPEYQRGKQLPVAPAWKNQGKESEPVFQFVGPLAGEEGLRHVRLAALNTIHPVGIWPAKESHFLGELGLGGHCAGGVRGTPVAVIPIHHGVNVLVQGLPAVDTDQTPGRRASYKDLCRFVIAQMQASGSPPHCSNIGASQ